MILVRHLLVLVSLAPASVLAFDQIHLLFLLVAHGEGQETTSLVDLVVNQLKRSVFLLAIL